MKLPYLDKNSYLAIYITSECVYANLIYADYTSGRSYTLSDKTDIRNSRKDIYQENFWVQYLAQLEKKFNWDFLRGSRVINVSAEGIGVSSIVVHIKNRGVKSGEIVPLIRSVSNEISFKIVNDEYIGHILKGIEERRKYEDIIHINLDLYSITLNRYSLSNNKRTLSQPLSLKPNSGSISWKTRFALIDSLRNAKFKAFLSTESPHSKIENTWANYVLKSTRETNSQTLADIIRSYITLSLLTISNENGEKFAQFGEKHEKNLIIVSGDLLKTVDPLILTLSILDGLEIKGMFDLVLDKWNKTLTLGRNYVLGQESKEFAVGISDIFDDSYKVIAPLVKGKRGERKVIFSGTMMSLEGQTEIYALSPEILNISIPDTKVTIEGKLLKDTSLGKNREIEFVSDKEEIKYIGLIIDGRFKPIIYGPDARTNRLKLSNWINESNQ